MKLLLKSIFILAFMSISLMDATGQAKFDMSIASKGGYEFNVFNANPSRTIIQDEDTLSSVQSGFYQRTELNTSLNLKSKVHDFKISGKVQHDYFPELRIADVTRSNLKLKYGIRIHKRVGLTFNGMHTLLLTNRPDDISEELTPPRGYERLLGEVRLKLKMHKMNTIYLQARQGKKVYKTPGSREFFYNVYGLKASMIQKLHNSKKVKHSLSVKLDYERRLYEDIRFDNEEDIDELAEREWIYYTLSGYYTLDVKKKFSLSGGVTIVERQDIIQDRFGYRQISPFGKISIKGRKVDVSLKASYGNRIYHTYQASSTGDEVLINGYMRGSFSLRYSITKKLSLVGRFSYLNRSRNFVEDARVFLPYENMNGSLGLRLDLF